MLQCAQVKLEERLLFRELDSMKRNHVIETFFDLAPYVAIQILENVVELSLHARVAALTRAAAIRAYRLRRC